MYTGMYKYIGVDEKTSVQTKVSNNDLSLREFPRNLKSDAKTKKIFRFCNLPHEIAADTEGRLMQLFINSRMKGVCGVSSVKIKFGFLAHVRKFDKRIKIRKFSLLIDHNRV